MRKVGIAIIGAGTAGLSARSEVAKQTDDYVVIDPGPLGTTCARIGCMPSKALIQVARDYHRVHDFDERRGIEGTKQITVSIPKVLQYVRQMRDDFVGGVLADMKSWQDSHWIPKRARFLEPQVLDVEGEQIFAETIIIATGSSPRIPEAWMPYRDYLLTTDELFECEDLPPKMAVIGMGAIGTEMGQALHQLGVQVLAYSRSKALGGLSDPELQDIATKVISEEMPLQLGEVQLRDIVDGQLVLECQGRLEHVDKALLAIGRKPNTDTLGLKEAGIACDSRGVPHFNKETFQVGDHSIYIAGDVNGERAVLHEANDEGRIAGYNASRAQDACFARRTSLLIAFSTPEIAVVGESFRDLTRRKVDFVTGAVSFQNQGRARILGENKGACRIYGDRKTGLILGAELMAPQGEHLAHLLAWAIARKQTAQQTLTMPFYHPVVEEGVRKAIRDLALQTQVERPALEVLTCQDPPVEHL